MLASTHSAITQLTHAMGLTVLVQRGRNNPPVRSLLSRRVRSFKQPLISNQNYLWERTISTPSVRSQQHRARSSDVVRSLL
ncbi:hypothetical protein [Limnofasciculus baicalensis]|nr:hypothetical protein [Limnofasciculus baicalensis]